MLVVVEDPDQVARVGKCWERRETWRVQYKHPIGKAAIKRARAAVLHELTRKCGLSGWARKTPK